ncbi:MAG: holo-ACP synthase [Armatimonadota bacterium]
MAIIGIGTDIIEIDRIKELIERQPRFLDRVYTKRELEICLNKENKYSSLSARFAAKESVAKALGSALGWHEVEILSNPDGSPDVRLNGRALGLVSKGKIFVSLSHSKYYATAIALVEME